MFVVGSVVYIGDGFDGLEIVEVSDLSSPSAVSSYASNGFAGEVTVSGDYAFLIDYNSPTHIPHLF